MTQSLEKRLVEAAEASLANAAVWNVRSEPGGHLAKALGG
jgi:hypothetical protein